MNNKKLKGRHHWWPEVLSKHWTNDVDLINAISHKGLSFTSPPKKVGRIQDGHTVILNEYSKLNYSFEKEFDRADSDIPYIIKTLNNLSMIHIKSSIKDTVYLAHHYNNAFLNDLCNSIVSLVIRSPMMRDITISLVNAIGTKTSKKELKLLSAMNISGKLSQVSNRLKDKGKFVVLFSETSEFIYGDGFYQNISMNLRCVEEERILVPLTPNITVLYLNPIQCMKEPRLLTIKADDKLVMLVNEMVQIYSKDFLFFKSEKPKLMEEFIRNEHLGIEYYKYLENLFNEVPGII